MVGLGVGDIDATMLGGPLPGDKRGSGGRTDGDGREGLGEIDPFVSKPVKVGRLDLPVSIDAKAIKPVLIRVNEQDVGTLLLHELLDHYKSWLNQNSLADGQDIPNGYKRP